MKSVNMKAMLFRDLAMILMIFSCLFMYDFYKCLSGFIANGFREALVMLPMILAFFLPVFCFLFFFYDYFIGKISQKVKLCYSVFVIIYAAADLALIFSNISLYVSNNSFGVYDALPSIIVHFPYDMIFILLALICLQVLNLLILLGKARGAGELMERLRQRGVVKVGILEYVIISVFAVVVFVFSGAAIYATFSSLSNALYDGKFIFLLLWALVIPLGDLLIVTLKPEKMNISKRRKIATLGSVISINILFAALFVIFELTSPDFMVHIGKPIFLITFSISLPIELAIILGLTAIATAICAVRLWLLLTKGEKQENAASVLLK